MSLASEPYRSNIVLSTDVFFLFTESDTFHKFDEIVSVNFTLCVPRGEDGLNYFADLVDQISRLFVSVGFSVGWKILKQRHVPRNNSRSYRAYLINPAGRLQSFEFESRFRLIKDFLPLRSNYSR